MKILGYGRPDKKVGIRNYLLILPVTRGSHMLAAKIAENVRYAKTFIAGDEDGRDSDDRMTMSRVFIGLGKNPNVGGVILVCNKKSAGYDELLPTFIASEISATGKDVQILDVEEQGGIYKALGEGIRKAPRCFLKYQKPPGHMWNLAN